MNKSHKLIRIFTYLTTYTWHWCVLACILSVIAGIEFTTGQDWAKGHGNGNVDPPALVMLFAVWLPLAILTIVRAACDEDITPKYHKRIISRSGGTAKLIEAEVDSDNGDIIIYECQQNIVSKNRDYLRRFSADEDDKIHEFVAERRQGLAGPDLSKSEAIAKSINKG